MDILQISHATPLAAARSKLDAKVKAHYAEHAAGAGAELQADGVQEEYARIKAQVGECPACPASPSAVRCIFAAPCLASCPALSCRMHQSLLNAA